MNSKRKEQYMAPAIEVIEMEAEGSVMSASSSGKTPDIGNGGNATPTSSRYNAARATNWTT